MLVVGTVEGAHRGLAQPARRTHGAGVEDELWIAVLVSGGAEDGAPHVLGAAEHLRDELAHLVGRRALTRGLRGFAVGRELLRGVHRRSGIDAEGVSDERDHYAAHAQAAGAEAYRAPIL